MSLYVPCDTEISQINCLVTDAISNAPIHTLHNAYITLCLYHLGLAFFSLNYLYQSTTENKSSFQLILNMVNSATQLVSPIEPKA